MAQGEQIPTDITSEALQAVRDMGAAAEAARLNVHVQTIARIESGAPGVAIGQVLGLPTLHRIAVQAPEPQDGSAHHHAVSRAAAHQAARCHKTPAPPVLQSEGSP
jgi:hypothetical protein